MLSRFKGSGQKTARERAQDALDTVRRTRQLDLVDNAATWRDLIAWAEAVVRQEIRPSKEERDGKVRLAMTLMPAEVEPLSVRYAQFALASAVLAATAFARGANYREVNKAVKECERAAGFAQGLARPSPTTEGQPTARTGEPLAPIGGGREAAMEIRKGRGPVDHVVNAYDHKRYTISTLLNPFGFHETAICLPLRFWKPWPTMVAGVSLYSSEQRDRARMHYDQLQAIGEKKHCLFVWVTEVTQRDMMAVHHLVVNTVSTVQRETWLRTIVDQLIPALKSTGMLRDEESGETLMRDFAERHTLVGPTREPAWVRIERFKQTGDPRDLK
jgi:hypothetical protein